MIFFFYRLLFFLFLSLGACCVLPICFGLTFGHHLFFIYNIFLCFYLSKKSCSIGDDLIQLVTTLKPLQLMITL